VDNKVLYYIEYYIPFRNNVKRLGNGIISTPIVVRRLRIKAVVIYIGSR